MQQQLQGSNNYGPQCTIIYYLLVSQPLSEVKKCRCSATDLRLVWHLTWHQPKTFWES